MFAVLGGAVGIVSGIGDAGADTEEFAEKGVALRYVGGDAEIAAFEHDTKTEHEVAFGDMPSALVIGGTLAGGDEHRDDLTGDTDPAYQLDDGCAQSGSVGN